MALFLSDPHPPTSGPLGPLPRRRREHPHRVRPILSVLQLRVGVPPARPDPRPHQGRRAGVPRAHGSGWPTLSRSWHHFFSGGGEGGRDRCHCRRLDALSMCPGFCGAFLAETFLEAELLARNRSVVFLVCFFSAVLSDATNPQPSDCCLIAGCPWTPHVMNDVMNNAGSPSTTHTPRCLPIPISTTPHLPPCPCSPLSGKRPLGTMIFIVPCPLGVHPSLLPNSHPPEGPHFLVTQSLERC